MNKITPCLWYDNDAEDAVNFYCSVFKTSKVLNMSRYPDSLMVMCDTQQEVDDYWAKLTANGGKESQCGWLEDKYGLSWQIVPRMLPRLMQDKDPEKRNRVMKALLKMVKLDIAELQRAAAPASTKP